MNEEHRSRLVFLIDDDAGVRKSLKFLLETIGHSVIAFASAAAFLATRPARAGCLIVDMFMPGMNGLELVSRLRADGDTMPVLLITGAPSGAIVSAAAQLDIDRVLSKPLAQDELLRWVDTHVGRGPGG